MVPEYLGHWSRDSEIIYFFYFGSFTEFDVMSKERPDLSRK